MNDPSRNHEYRYGSKVGDATYAPDGACPARITSTERAARATVT
jgi:hypothetical protein